MGARWISGSPPENWRKIDSSSPSAFSYSFWVKVRGGNQTRSCPIFATMSWLKCLVIRSAGGRVVFCWLSPSSSSWVGVTWRLNIVPSASRGSGILSLSQLTMSGFFSKAKFFRPHAVLCLLSIIPSQYQRSLPLQQYYSWWQNSRTIFEPVQWPLCSLQLW